MPAVPMLGDSAARARAATQEQQRLAEVKANEPVQAVTSFLVYITAEGEVVLSPDINIPITVQRPPSADEVRGACHVVEQDVTTKEIVMATVQNTVQNVVMNLQRLGQAQMEQMENAQMLGQGGPQAVPAGFRRPGK